MTLVQMKRADRVSSNRAIDGFTLFELLLVLTIVAVLASVAVVRMPSTSSSAQLKAGAREVAATLRLARGQAVAENREIRFLLNVQKRLYRIEDRNSAQLPQHVKLSIYTAASELVRSDEGAIRFFSDGSSTGGRINLQNSTNGEPGVTVAVDWYTGRVSVDQ